MLFEFLSVAILAYGLAGYVELNRRLYVATASLRARIANSEKAIIGRLDWNNQIILHNLERAEQLRLAVHNDLKSRHTQLQQDLNAQHLQLQQGANAQHVTLHDSVLKINAAVDDSLQEHLAKVNESLESHFVNVDSRHRENVDVISNHIRNIDASVAGKLSVTVCSVCGRNVVKYKRNTDGTTECLTCLNKRVD
jgi:DNA anti-recombination protein RmuC